MRAGRNLVSKIAAVYNNMLPELPAPVVRDEEEFHDPELDRAIDELVERYKNKPPDSNAVVQFLDPLSSAQAVDTKAEERDIEKSEGGNTPESACPACGEPSTRRARFCAMCGMPLLTVAAGSDCRQQESEPLATIAELQAEHPHDAPTRHRTSAYLLGAIFILLAVISGLLGWENGLRHNPSKQPTLPSTRKAPPATVEAPSVTVGAPLKQVTRMGEIDSAAPTVKLPAVKVKQKRKLVSTTKASSKQQAQPDSSADDDEVVWIRRASHTGK